MNEVIGGLHDGCTIRYLDNILIYSDGLNNHHLHVSKILCHLQEAGLYANPKKCIFHTDTVEYLGFILSPEGLRMDPSKVDACYSWFPLRAPSMRLGPSLPGWAPQSPMSSCCDYYQLVL